MGLLRGSAELLARKIVERAGHTGEHYITSSRREWVGMLLSAAGGGILTAGTTFAKFLIGRFKLPFFLEGLAASVNYSASSTVTNDSTIRLDDGAILGGTFTLAGTGTTRRTCSPGASCTVE